MDGILCSHVLHRVFAHYTAKIAVLTATYILSTKEQWFMVHATMLLYT